MEELLVEKYKYTFVLTGNREFTARFEKIEQPTNTLHVSDYTDTNGSTPGIRTMPFRWVKKVQLLDNYGDIETIELISTSNNKNKKPKKINNYMS
tara:strand:+ start:240 stop:524 length:285 start_codon:yes stop_codon:yes gene_type:complete